MNTVAKDMRVQVIRAIASPYEEYAGQIVTVQAVNNLMLIAQADDGKWLYLYREEIVEVSE